MSLKSIIKLVQKELNVSPDGVAGLITWGAIYRSIFKEDQKEELPSYAQEAFSYLGVKEVPGRRSNPTILNWIQDFFPWASDDGELAWCAIFINKMLQTAGIKGTGKANARSFLNWGYSTQTPKKGDIVVFWRGKKTSWKGHVGLYWGEAEDGYIYCLGGNQSNKVSVAKYPKYRVLGYRTL